MIAKLGMKLYQMSFLSPLEVREITVTRVSRLTFAGEGPILNATLQRHDWIENDDENTNAWYATPEAAISAQVSRIEARKAKVEAEAGRCQDLISQLRSKMYGPPQTAEVYREGWAVEVHAVCGWCGAPDVSCLILHTGHSDGAHAREVACASCLKNGAEAAASVEASKVKVRDLGLARLDLDWVQPGRMVRFLGEGEGGSDLARDEAQSIYGLNCGQIYRVYKSVAGAFVTKIWIDVPAQPDEGFNSSMFAEVGDL